MSYLDGIEYPLLAGAGALLGLILGAPIVAVLALFWPALWGWVFAPCAVGAVVGLILALGVRD